jgi:hypothetical protein
LSQFIGNRRYLAKGSRGGNTGKIEYFSMYLTITNSLEFLILIKLPSTSMSLFHYFLASTDLYGLIEILLEDGEA